MYVADFWLYGGIHCHRCPCQGRQSQSDCFATDLYCWL